MNHVLLVDDDAAVLAALQRNLRQGFGPRLHCEAFTDALLALQRSRVQPFDLVIADLRMPDVDGISFLSLIAAIQPHAVRMMLTGSADFDTAQRAINEAGVFRYLCKPWTPQDLQSHVEAALALARSRAAEETDNARAALERQRLERLEPGITHVEFGPGGEVLMPPLDQAST